MKKLIVFLFLLMIAGCGGNKDDMVKGYFIGFVRGGKVVAATLEQAQLEQLNNLTETDWLEVLLTELRKDKKSFLNTSSTLDKDLVTFKELLKDVHYEKEGV